VGHRLGRHPMGRIGVVHRLGELQRLGLKLAVYRS
jgi:hypothetical protein